MAADSATRPSCGRACRRTRAVGLAAATLLALLHGRAAPAEPGRPHVVLVVVDTLRADHLSTYGYRRETSPGLTAWAREAAVFTQARSNASCTFPSVNSLLTSRHPSLFLGQPGGRMGIPDAFPTLPGLLRVAGYRTVAVTASPIVRRSPSRFNPEGGFGAGFDVVHEGCVWGPADCVRRAATALVAPQPSRPLFLYLHFMDPHGPYRPPASHPRRWATQATGTPAIDAGDPTPLARRLAAGAPAAAAVTASELQHLVDLYDEEIRHLDAQLALLLRELATRLSPRSTLVILASDHGESFLEHGTVKHCNGLYDAEIRTPLLIRPPGGRGGRVATPVSNLDILPTVLDYSGVTGGGARFEGASLRPLIEGRDRPPTDVLAIQGHLRALVREGRKLIWDLRRHHLELYDLTRDPEERQDLAPGERRRVRPLLERLRAALAARGDGASREHLRIAAEAEQRLRALGYLE